jgi:NAD(P)-dependent dehydrogenase (short-subunit alcohol dehydrogenase family)
MSGVMGMLEGKVALITGTGGGQGRAAALAFTREGAKVVGIDLKSEENEKTAALVRDAGGEMTVLPAADLTDPEQVKQFVDAGAGCYDGFDIMYNNAARAWYAPLGEYSLEHWHATIRGELDIVFYGTRYAWSHLIERGSGVVISIASMAGVLGSRDMPMVGHSASKAGVIGFMRQVAVEGAPHGIRAVTISPGPIATPAIDLNIGDDHERRQSIAERTLMRRWGRPENIAEVAAFLASDRAEYITGINVPVDGGMSAF